MSSFFLSIKTKIIAPAVLIILGLFGIAETPPAEIYVATEKFSAIPAMEEKIAATMIATTSVQGQPKTVAPPRAATPTAGTSLRSRERETIQKIDRGEFLPAEEVNKKTRPALINVYCTILSGGNLKSISGSGIIMNETGLILTNAHIAQYFLLKEYAANNTLECVGRAGSPAVPRYTLELAYIPGEWLGENALKIHDERPVGTGERDYAFLAITGAIGNVPLLTPLPRLEAEKEEVLVTGTPVLLAAYPAGFLGGITVEKELWLTSSVADIKSLFYFKEPGSADVFSVDGNILSQKGASGGGAVSLLSGNLLGLITTATDAETTGERELMAITLPYIRKQFEKDEGKTLEALLGASPEKLIQEFNETKREALTAMLVRALERR